MEKFKKQIYTIDGEKVQPGTRVHNFLENTDYVTDTERCIVLTGTVGEQGPVTEEKLHKTYTVSGEEDGRGRATTKPDDQTVFVEMCTEPQDIQTSWGDVLQAHVGDAIVYADKGGEPDPNDRGVINGKVFQTTYQKA